MGNIKRTSISSGFTMIDRISSGWVKGQLIVVTGRPSMGKSTFVNTTFLHTSRTQEAAVIYFSLHSSAEQVVMRFMSMETGIATRRLHAYPFDESQRPILMEAAKILGNGHIIVDSTPVVSLDLIKARCYAALAEHKELALVVVDGADLISPNASGGGWERDTDFIARELKKIARQFEVPIIVTVSSSRTSEQRADKRPMLIDLPEPWEQTADMILGLYCEDLYIEDTDRQNIMEVMVMKNLEGHTGVIHLFFDREVGVVKNLEVRTLLTEY